jgi:hypothetical protein
MDSHEQTTTGVFPDDTWRTANYCGPNGGNCVEVNLAARGLAGIRDSKPGDGPVLAFGQAVWQGFLEATRSGRLTCEQPNPNRFRD